MPRYLVSWTATYAETITTTTDYEAEVDAEDDAHALALAHDLGYSAWHRVNRDEDVDATSDDGYAVIRRLDDADDEPPVRGKPSDFGMAQPALLLIA